jgi:hypothetical protein
MSAQDFDFLHGSWRISHRYLRERLTGGDEWDTFESTMRCRPILGGAGNMDEGELRGYHAITVRLHDPESGLWSLYWMTSRTGAAIEPPVSGRFAGAVGEFLGPDVHDGKPVVCRYRWTVLSPDACRWEQALSPDDGETWETNWYMDLSREVREGQPTP